MIRGVLFDLGSTLLYSSSDNNWGTLLPRMRADLLRHLTERGHPLEPQTFLNRLAANYADFDAQRQNDWVEYTTAYLLNTTLAELGAPLLSAEAMQSAIKAYYAYSETTYALMPDAHATLATLQAAGLRVGLVSNASDHDTVQRLIDRFELRRYFHPILVSAAVTVRKPNPKIFALALNEWELPAGECVMVGDTLGADILGAQMAGLRNVWLTAHADTPANRAHAGNIVPEASLERLAALPALLRQWGAPL
jgi:putative hydrolase of the HAD superfamily